MTSSKYKAFTLIELSIVLVIIGLIVGGVLVGRDLIAAAGVRAQISQIEKYQQAVNTFRGKYGYLPGDIPDPDATRFGFAARGQYAGQGDGNGLVIGGSVLGAGFTLATGEQVMFWADLSAAKLIDGNFTTASSTANTCSDTNLDLCLPHAKIVANDYIYVYSPGYCCDWTSTDSFNHFNISGITVFYGTGWPTSQANIPVAMAYAIDAKIDDGMPHAGRVTTSYSQSFGAGVWVGFPGAGFWLGPYTNAAAASATTCTDNGGVSGAQQRYSTVNNGQGSNCALSFRFQ